MTAIGWLEGQQFYYDELDPAGQPVFPNRLAGTVEDLTLILADGARLTLNEIPYEVEIDPSDIPISRNPSSSGHRPTSPSDQHGIEGVLMSGKHPFPILLAAGAALILGILFGVKQAKRFPTRKLR